MNIAIKLSALAASAILAMPPASAATVMSEAWNAYNSGNYEQALYLAMRQENYSPMADAEYLAGTMLLHGQGTGANYAAAAFRFGQAAQKGHAESQCMFASMLLNGQGVAKNTELARQWLDTAIR